MEKEYVVSGDYIVVIILYLVAVVLGALVAIRRRYPEG